MSRWSIVTLLVVVAAVGAAATTASESGSGGGGGNSKRLQIGVKRRVENCQSRSRKGDVLHMHYRGTLEDGTEFDSSYNRGDPLTFTLGSGQVIRGWDQGLLAMCVGEKRKLVIPPELAYGSRGAPPTIPGDATLTFEVELVKIDRKTEL
ncbi:peptidyl-prolyl cis-trans isomerase FKBP2-like [Haemaphysalis longicornis]